MSAKPRKPKPGGAPEEKVMQLRALRLWAKVPGMPPEAQEYMALLDAAVSEVASGADATALNGNSAARKFEAWVETEPAKYKTVMTGIIAFWPQVLAEPAEDPGFDAAALARANNRRRRERWDAGEDLPPILANDRQLRDLSNEGLEALVRVNDPPELFVRGGMLSRLRWDEKDHPIIGTMDENSLRGRLARVADWKSLRQKVTEGKDGEKVVKDIETQVPPPIDVVRDILALGRWPFPRLTGITETPAIRPDGTILRDAGYDTASGLYYAPAPGLEVGTIPEKPTPKQMEAVKALLLTPWQDFPFVSEADRANVLALMLSGPLLPAIDGLVPMALLDATDAGTGKGLAADIVSLVATGRPMALTPLAQGDELRKTLTSLFIEGTTMICFDNVTGVVKSGYLAQAMTGRGWKDRVLGKSEAPNLENRVVWAATGNNIQLGGDMPRRCYLIRMDAKMTQPWTRKRKGFKIPDLRAWVLKNRGGLIAAALTLARGWYAAGCPEAEVPELGSYEEWTRVIGGILTYAGVDGFLGNLQEMYADADPEGAAWETFLLELTERFPNRGVTVAEVCEALRDSTDLREVAPDLGEEMLDGHGEVRQKFKQRLGLALRARKGRRHHPSGARALGVKGDSHAKVGKWYFRAGENDAADAPGPVQEAMPDPETAKAEKAPPAKAGPGRARPTSDEAMAKAGF